MHTTRRPGVLTTCMLACLLACLLPCCSQPARVSPPEPPTDAPTVITYNIHHAEGTDGVLDLERIAAVINTSGAELVALQEVDRNASRTGIVDQAAELARLTDMHHAFVPFMDFQGGEYGLAILSAHPIGSVRRIALPPGRQEPRAALAAEIFIPGAGSVTLVCLHLDWLDDDTERFAQAGALIAALDAETPVILAGDFNDTPGSRTMRLFAETYADAAKPAGGRATYPSHAPATEIDFVLYRPAYAWVGSSRVLDGGVASDHRPVLATLELVR